VREGKDVEKGYSKVNMVEIYYILMYENGKMRHVETIPGMGEGGIKGDDGGSEFIYDIL
jgi:hypothetical protein